MSTRSTSASGPAASGGSVRALAPFHRAHRSARSPCALLTLFEILEVAGAPTSNRPAAGTRAPEAGADFLSQQSDISEEALSGVLRDIEQAAAALFSMTGRIGSTCARTNG